MSNQLYAFLDPTHTSIVDFETIDTAVYPTLAPGKKSVLIPVNITSQPIFNPATQSVSQNGWVINYPTDVEPVWVINNLSTEDVNWNQVLSLNLITAFNAYIATAVPTQAATNSIVLNLVKCVSALLQSKYNISN